MYHLKPGSRPLLNNLIYLKNVCDKFGGKDREKSIRDYVDRLRKEIRNAEIGDIILKGLNMEATPEEEKSYIELIERGLQRGNVNLRAIPLGKSKDGLKDITLADIWPVDERQIMKSLL